MSEKLSFGVRQQSLTPSSVYGENVISICIIFVLMWYYSFNMQLNACLYLDDKKYKTITRPVWHGKNLSVALE